MSNNLQGETIPMAYSCFLKKSRNIQQENLVYSIQKFRLKQLFRSGKLRRRENEDEYKKELCQKRNVMKQLWKNNDEHLIKKKEQSINEFETKMSYHFSNQPILFKMNNPYSNFLAQPLEVLLSENMSIYLRGETIPMAYSRFLDIWNDKQEDIINYPSSIILRFGKKVEDDNKNNSNQTRCMKNQLPRNNVEFLIEKKKQPAKKSETKMSYQFSNQPNLLEMNNPYSNPSAPPLEVYLPENMSTNLRVKRFPRLAPVF
jgi:hypothetical protein